MTSIIFLTAFYCLLFTLKYNTIVLKENRVYTWGMVWMTKRIFDIDVMRRSCPAVVTACVPRKGGYAVTLDQTVFFPEGGGQLSDVGILKADDSYWQVTHVAEKDGEVYHEVAEAIPEGTQVEAVLDWQTRMDYMQQHCGEHLVSYAFSKLYDAHNVGFHMNPELVTIDLDKEVSWEQAMEAEKLANQHIQDDRPVTIQVVTPEEAAAMNLRKFNAKIKGPARIVAIEGSDTCTCCGTHPPTTGMIGLVKIFKVMRHRGGTRLTMLAGRLALERIRMEMEAATQAANLLSIKEEELLDGVKRLKEEHTTLTMRLHERTAALMETRIAKLLEQPHVDGQGNQCIALFEDTMEPDEAKFLMKRLQEVPKAVITLLYHNSGRLHYSIAVADGAAADAGVLIRDLNERFQGRGGGKGQSAQGSAPYTKETAKDVRDFLDSLHATDATQSSEDEDDSEEMYKQAEAYRLGSGVPKDMDKARELYEAICDAHGAYAGKAAYSLGCAYINGEIASQDFKTAVTWFHKAADEGLDWGYYNLAISYYAGNGVEADAAKAVDFLEKAYELDGDAAGKAAHLIGTIYAEGKRAHNGPKQDESLAATWFGKSADKGCDWGTLDLGQCYYNGDGVDKDKAKAHELFEAAYKAHGEAAGKAAWINGNCYYQENNSREAIEWLKIAASAGGAYAEEAEKKLRDIEMPNKIAGIWKNMFRKSH